MPFSMTREDRRKYIQFQRFALDMRPGPTAAPLATDANHTHGVENLYGMTQIVELPEASSHGRNLVLTWWAE